MAARLFIPDGTGITSGDKLNIANLYYGEAVVTGQMIDIRSNVLTSDNTLIFTNESGTLVTIACTNTPVMVTQSTTLDRTCQNTTPVIATESLTQFVTIQSISAVIEQESMTQSITIESTTPTISIIQ